MTRIALVEPQSLFARECAQRLLDREPSTDVRGFSGQTDQVGELVEFGRHGLIIESDADVSAEDFDALIYCGPSDPATIAELLQSAADCGARWILIDAQGSLISRPETLLLPPDVTARAVLPPLPSEPPAGGEVLILPRPSLLSRLTLLRALGELEPQQAISTSFSSASNHGAGGLDELLDQARRLLAFSDLEASEILGGQLAFNLRSAVAHEESHAAESVLARSIAVSDQTLEVGAFHGIASSMVIQFAERVPVDALRTALSADSAIEIRDRVELIDVAGSARLLVQAPRSDEPASRQHWLWLAADPLTRAGAWAAADLALSGAEITN